MFTAFLVSILLFTNLPETQKQAIEILNDSGVQAEFNNRGFVLFVPSLQFELGSSKVDRADENSIKTIVNVLNLNGIDDDVVYVEGHASRIGDDDLNLPLSVARAQSVKWLLEKHGINPQRTLSTGHGSTIPRYTDPYDQRNQRVEIVVVDLED